ncbi:MAG: LysR family transcriptional regulator [Lentisphaeria bacterium]|nr:LysR family transcriptional regulator [Lentisphaeria bacterium]
MELRLLRYFLAVARENSFTRAAKYLHVTQPTLSRQMMDLEEELGQKLLNRETHHIALTPEGMLLRRRAEEIMAMVQKTEAEFNAIGENISGDVYIGGGESKAMNLIADAVCELHGEYPDVRFHIYTGVAGDVMERLDNGLLDFGVLLQPVDIAKYDSVNLPVKDKWGVLMRRDNPLAEKESVTPEDLRELPLICSRRDLRNKSVRNPYAEWFDGDLDKLNIVAVYNLIFNASLLVERGIGCALALEPGNNITGDRLCFRPLNPALESHSSVVWKKYQIFSKAAEVFLERLQDEFAASETRK